MITFFRHTKHYMFKISIAMVKTRSMRSSEPSAESSNELNISYPTANFEFNHSEPLSLQPSIPFFYDRGMAVFKKTLLLFGMTGIRCLEKIPAVLGIFGGFYALYQIFSTNIEHSNEKMEIVVLRRSFS